MLRECLEKLKQESSKQPDLLSVLDDNLEVLAIQQKTVVADGGDHDKIPYLSS